MELLNTGPTLVGGPTMEEVAAACFKRVTDGWGPSDQSRLAMGNGVTATTAGAAGCGGNVIVSLGSHGRATFEVMQLPDKHCIELGIWNAGMGDDWRAPGVQLRCLLQDGSLYGAYCKALPGGHRKPFDRVGSLFGVELDPSHREARFMVDGEVQDTFDIPAAGVVVVVRLHTSGRVVLRAPVMTDEIQPTDGKEEGGATAAPVATGTVVQTTTSCGTAATSSAAVQVQTEAVALTSAETANIEVTADSAANAGHNAETSAEDSSATYAMRPLTTFVDPRLRWMNAPDQWKVPANATCADEGFGGSFSISTDELKIVPPSKKDFWRRTFYEPQLIKGDASALVCTVPAKEECSVEVAFSFTPRNQFDQCGVLIWLDKVHWLKTGIEWTDGRPWLSVVVCNVYSDWSVQPWPSCAAKLRLHKVNNASSVVVEAQKPGGDGWMFVRICHLSSMASHRGLPTEPESVGSDSESPWQVGPFSACTMEQKGCVATFTHFEVSKRKPTCHEANL